MSDKELFFNIKSLECVQDLNNPADRFLFSCKIEYRDVENHSNIMVGGIEFEDGITIDGKISADFSGGSFRFDISPNQTVNCTKEDLGFTCIKIGK
jgi:hypothetical protein